MAKARQGGDTGEQILSVFPVEYDPEMLEIIRLVLFDQTRYTLLPELWDVFGAGAFLKFLQVFSGQEFVVPSTDLLIRVIHHASIYRALKRNRSSANVDYLARQYDISAVTVWTWFQRVEAVMKAHEEGSGGGGMGYNERFG